MTAPLFTRCGSLRGILVIVASSSTVLGACAGAPVAARWNGQQQMLRTAREGDAERCAPTDFAVAEANHMFAGLDLAAGRPGRAAEHLDIAQKAAERALAALPACPKTSLVIAPAPEKPILRVTVADADSDGILGSNDACPTDPEDFDGFQDSDGCPEPDNDQDGVLDAQDQCPLQPGTPLRQGCPIVDTDKDGVPDELDRCPTEPEDRDGIDDEDGCPDPDNDQDGVLDAQDACPVEPGLPANGGCPVYDADQDGVRDNVDRCPRSPEDLDQFRDEDGCPDPDNDEDGILDGADRCPLQAGIAETGGCPPTDRDQDGIFDHVDRCPDEPGVAEEQGCPRKLSLVVLRAEKIEIKQQVHFATKKHRILPDSYELLGQVAQVLIDAPRIKLRIEGHTDSQGDDAFNLKLSQLRADAVREFLMQRGISADRMVAVGYGETMPIATNSSDKGRAQNRRVEFNITEK